MKKTLLTLSALTLMSSVAMASPVVDLQKGEFVAGYNYWHTSIKVASNDLGSTNTNGFYIETAINEDSIISVETMKGSKSTVISGAAVDADTKFTDVILKSKINENLQLIMGNRCYDTSVSASAGGMTQSNSETTNKFIYGIGAKTNISENTTAYATYIHSDIANDWQAGINHNLDKDLAINVHYREYKEDDFSLKGVGAGVSYKF